MSEILDYFNENLSGSGFDCVWTEQETKDGYILETSFHVLDNAGFYVGYAAFVLTIDSRANCFDLTPKDIESSLLLSRYYLYEYIEEIVAECLHDFRERGFNYDKKTL